MRYAICGRRKRLVECGASDECKYWACTPWLHKNQKPTNCTREGDARSSDFGLRGRRPRENQEFPDELSIPMEIKGLKTDQANVASKPESANNSKHQWRRGSVPSDDRIMKHEGRQEAEGLEV
ncbi:hypothetical protein E4U17_002783 [Claviceps sp. LM77 group G4]|nr:hypothetical protein E4U17_002783 [Claviceps sp. LM77 group G4]KAG6074737.1 hypothetical protein E4U33_002316 [Claviceps sp. LM78 group G4]KAG6081501.1 hypothetical protein E4U16_007337 [Claviceps sp. LM84 group G4]